MPASDIGLLDVVSKVGERRGVEARGLAVRARLHLPRVARPDGTVGRRLALAEVSRSVRHLSADIAAIRRLVPTGGVRDLDDLRFVVYDDEKAFAVFTHMHYLRSARPGSVNFALVDRSSGLPVALCSATPLDWRRLGSALEQRYGVPVEQIWGYLAGLLVRCRALQRDFQAVGPGAALVSARTAERAPSGHDGGPKSGVHRHQLPSCQLAGVAACQAAALPVPEPAIRQPSAATPGVRYRRSTRAA